MLYLIGLGLSVDGFSYGSYNAVKNSRVIYIDNYTIELPYKKEELEELVQKKIREADREFVEGFEILKEAKEKNVALLVYGSPMMATTHISLIEEARKKNIPTRIIHGASVFDGVSETGLQLYKFGKITSMPKFESESFAEVIKENSSIKAHSLILIDIGLDFKDALKKLKKSSEKKNLNLEKIIACSKLGTKNSGIFYDKIKKLKKENVKPPFCFIIPSDLHFVEREFLELVGGK